MEFIANAVGHRTLHSLSGGKEHDWHDFVYDFQRVVHRSFVKAFSRWWHWWNEVHLYGINAVMFC